jgi:hypothetical protein
MAYETPLIIENTGGQVGRCAGDHDQLARAFYLFETLGLPRTADLLVWSS